MTTVMRAPLKMLTEGEMPSADDIRACFNAIMDGEISQIQMAAFLTALKMRGERVEDIAAAAAVMREKATVIDAPDSAIDIVGTGGDGIGTYNISTATAFVVAGAGVPVAKHGNKAVSSKSGAADVLSSLGIKVDCEMTRVRRALAEAGICFLMAPRHHSAMRHVARCGPSSASGRSSTCLARWPIRRWSAGSWSACSIRHCAFPSPKPCPASARRTPGLFTAPTGLTRCRRRADKVAALAGGTIEEFTISPDDLGLANVSIDALRGGTPEENESLRDVLNGAEGAHRDVVIFNAAGTVGGGHAANLSDGAERATASIASGRAMTALETLVAITNSETESA